MGMPTVPDNIRTYIIATLSLTEPVDINQMNASSINRYAIVEYQGFRNVHVHGDSLANVAFDETNIQIQCRNTKAQTARNNLKAVVDVLDGAQDITIASKRYTYIERISPVRLHEKQEDGSVVYIAEFRVQVARD